jgi:hypothetical protein
MLEEFTRVITTSQLTLPAFELMLLMILLALALLFRYSRTGIILAYLFTYRWGWEITGQLSRGAHLSYMIFGVIVGILSVLGMFADTKE